MKSVIYMPYGEKKKIKIVLYELGDNELCNH